MYLVKCQVKRQYKDSYFDNELNIYTEKKIDEIPSLVEAGARSLYVEDYSQFTIVILSINTINGVII